MVKKLLSIFAVAILGIGAYAADTVLWQSETEEGVLIDWGQPCYKMTAAEAQAQIAPGDFLKVKVASTVAKDADGNDTWPQVALFPEAGGWPPLTNSFAGADNYPNVLSFAITNEIATEIHENGLSVAGNFTYVSEVALEKGEPIGPFTVWFGNKECNWGNGVSLPASLFADVEANGMLSFYTSNQSFQVLLGGWSGLNLPSYAAASIPNMEYADGITTITFIEEYETTNEYDQDGNMKEFNVFELMKANGVIMHGPTTITKIDYIPGKLINEMNADEEKINELATALQGLNNQVAEEFPGFAVLKADEFTALTAAIEDLNNKLIAGKEAAWETGVYVGPSQEDFMNVTMTLMGLITEMEETAQAILAEYDADIEAINALATGLQELGAQIDEELPGYAVLKADEIAALNATIEALNNKANEGLEKAFETGVYEGPAQEDVVNANEALMALSAGLDATIAAIMEEYEADIENINELTLAFGEFLDGMEETWPGYLVLKKDEIEALTATIEALNNQVVAGLEAAFETGEYNGPAQTDIVEATETLMGLVAGVTELMEAATAELQEVGLTMDEWKGVLKAIADGSFTNFEEEDMPFEAWAIVNADKMDELTTKVVEFDNTVAEAYEAFYTTGVLELPSAEVEKGITDEIMGFVAEGQEAYVAIMNAYTADYETLYKIYGKIEPYLDDETLSEDKSEEAEALTGEVTTLLQAVMAAEYEALRETAEYVSPLNAEEVADLEARINNFITTGIQSIEASSDAKYFDLNGNAIETPAAGKVYIRVANGKASKVLVK